jgi:hypothetical protein
MKYFDSFLYLSADKLMSDKVECELKLFI